MREDYGKMFDEMVKSSGEDADILEIAKDVMNTLDNDLMRDMDMMFAKTTIRSSFSSYESMKDFVGIGYLRQLLSAENHLPEGISDEDLAICAEKMKADERYVDEYLKLLEKSAN